MKYEKESSMRVMQNCTIKLTIFDHYYDKYKKEFKWLKQSKGTLRPNLWNSTAKAPQRKRKKRSSADGELK